MLNHLSIGVSDLAQSIKFYDAVFEPLDYARLWKNEDGAGYGYPGEQDESFAIKQEKEKFDLSSSPRSHLAFTAKTRDMVVAFHRAALENGGACQGEPGLRPHYSENYYAAFASDPDGYKLEAVCHLAV